jgi:hypothetical protein
MALTRRTSGSRGSKGGTSSQGRSRRVFILDDLARSPAPGTPPLESANSALVMLVCVVSNVLVFCISCESRRFLCLTVVIERSIRRSVRRSAARRSCSRSRWGSRYVERALVLGPGPQSSPASNAERRGRCEDVIIPVVILDSDGRASHRGRPQTPPLDIPRLRCQASSACVVGQARSPR